MVKDRVWLQRGEPGHAAAASAAASAAAGDSGPSVSAQGAVHNLVCKFLCVTYRYFIDIGAPPPLGSYMNSKAV
jgi:hypothetical protein